MKSQEKQRDFLKKFFIWARHDSVLEMYPYFLYTQYNDKQAIEKLFGNRLYDKEGVKSIWIYWSKKDVS